MNRKHFSTLAVGLSALFAVAASQATMPGEIVENFKLADHTGKTRSLYEPGSTKPVVLMIQGNGCPIVRHSVPALKQISDKYGAQGVRFLLLNPNLQDNAQSIAKEVEEFVYPFPVLVDQKQKIGEKLHVQRTSEVFVIDPQTKKLLYRGPIDDRLSYERQRPATKTYLIDALDATLAGETVKVPYADGVGCIVNFPNRRTTHVEHSQTDHSSMDHSKMGH